MALTITVAITVADDQAYTPREAAVIASLQAHPSQGAAAVVPAAEPAPAKPARRKPDADAGDAILAKAKADLAAKQAAEAAELKAAQAAEVAAEEEASAVAEQAVAAAAAVVAAAEEDLVGGTEPTMQDAVDKATKAVSEGKQAQVKAALLAAGGAKRVSELKTPAAIATFITALEG